MLFKERFRYLFERQSDERQGDEERVRKGKKEEGIFHMSSTVRTGPGSRQEPKLHSGFHVCGRDPRT